jgi:phage-related tail protein
MTRPSAVPPPRLADPFNMNEEIDYVFRKMAGEPSEKELRDVIDEKHNHLIQRLNESVNRVLGQQDEMEDIIDELIDESAEIDMSSIFQLRLQGLREQLEKVKQDHSTLSQQIKTNAAFLSCVKGHTEELRTTARSLKATVQKASPQTSSSSAEILAAGSLLSMTLA